MMAGTRSLCPPPGRRGGEMLDQGIATSNKVPQPRVVLTGPVAILWDIENCPVPGDINAEDVAANIRMALQVHPAVKGAITMFSAYGDFNHFPRRLREGCQRTGVNLIDVPNGKKDASDKAILVDMFLFALDNPSPCTILLISGDVDFAPALHKLGQRGYMMVLAIPTGGGVSSVLCNAGRFVWDWPSVARGDGLVPAKAFLNRFGEERMAELPAYMMGLAWQLSDNSDFPPEDERYVYNSWWVQPGDLQGLKGQLRRLVKLNGGKLQLLRIPSEYCKLYGRPLILAEYGSTKLIHLIERMPDAFSVKGDGSKRTLHLKENVQTLSKHIQSRPNVSLDMRQEDESGADLSGQVLGDVEEFVEDIVLLQQHPEMGSDEEKASEKNEEGDEGIKVLQCVNEEGEVLDGEAYMVEVLFEVFRQEVQELLVSHACKIPLSSFRTLYKQRYARDLDVVAFGVEELEALFERIQDVAIVKVDKATSWKFLVARQSG